MAFRLRILLGLVLAVTTVPALAVLNVFATVPEWGALVDELGGDKVKVYVATNALQDPHHIEAKPSLIARARAADLVVATGAELEIGWLPLVTQQAGNPAIKPGKPGYFEAAPYVTLLDKPARLDRAEGDVHPGGDPHIQTDPRNIAKSRDARLRRGWPSSIRRTRRGTRRATKPFSERWNAAIAHWEKQAAPLKGVKVVVQHKAFTYLHAWLNRCDCSARTQAGGRADHGASCRKCWNCCSATPPRWCCAPPIRMTDRRSGSPSARRSTSSCCPRPSVVTMRRRISTAYSTTRSRVS